MKNKSQLAAEARAKKQTTEAPEKLIEYDVKEAIARGEGERGGHDTPEVEAVKATPAPAPAATVSKQDLTVEKLKEGWTAIGVDLSKMTIKDEGKFKDIVPAEGWPTYRLGVNGGVVMMVRSYPEGKEQWTSWMTGNVLLAKQIARDQKKLEVAQPKPVAAAPKAPEAAPVAAKETVTSKKQKQDAEIEKQLQSAVS